MLRPRLNQSHETQRRACAAWFCNIHALAESQFCGFLKKTLGFSEKFICGFLKVTNMLTAFQSIILIRKPFFLVSGKPVLFLWFPVFACHLLIGTFSWKKKRILQGEVLSFISFRYIYIEEHLGFLKISSCNATMSEHSPYSLCDSVEIRMLVEGGS